MLPSAAPSPPAPCGFLRLRAPHRSRSAPLHRGIGPARGPHEVVSARVPAATWSWARWTMRRSSGARSSRGRSPERAHPSLEKAVRQIFRGVLSLEKAVRQIFEGGRMSRESARQIFLEDRMSKKSGRAQRLALVRSILPIVGSPAALGQWHRIVAPLQWGSVLGNSLELLAFPAPSPLEVDRLVLARAPRSQMSAPRTSGIPRGWWRTDSGHTPASAATTLRVGPQPKHSSPVTRWNGHRNGIHRVSASADSPAP